jgi:subtilisin family serine protease
MQVRSRCLATLVALLAASVAMLGSSQAAQGEDPPGPPAAGDPLELERNEATVRYAPGKLVVGLEDSASAARVERAMARAGARPKRTIGKLDARVVDVPSGEVAEAISELRADPAVEYVEREVLLERADTTPNDTLWRNQWGPKLVRAPKAWDATRGSSATVIAILDTGVDFRHRDLQGAFVAGYDAINNDGDPTDDHGHGTAVAGIVAARTQNEVGQAGACWRCALMPVKVLDASGWGTTSAIAAGIVWATDHGADVISMSLGGAGQTQALADAVAYAAARDVLVVAAAGNAGSTAPFFPAAYPGVVSVAGTTASDNLYPWSNRGAWVRVAAPGCNTAPRRGGGYESFCGTSSATPLVSGLAGLALSLAPETPSVALAHALEAGAVARPDAIVHGRVDAFASLATLRLVPPLNLTRPRIKGTARRGETVHAAHGKWLGAEAFRYRWKRCDARGERCSRIRGARGASYAIRRADVGKTLRVRVRARNSKGAALVRSRPSALVARGTNASSATTLASTSTTSAGESGASPQTSGESPTPCATCAPSPGPEPDPTTEIVSEVTSAIEEASNALP